MPRHANLPPSGDRRGLFSCLYSSKCDDARPDRRFEGKGSTEILEDIIVDMYEQAFDRLPVEDMPSEDAEKLVASMCRGGLCVGLLDPVYNIILNTIAGLPRDFRPKPPPRDTRSKKRLAAVAQPDYVWSVISGLSCAALVRFLVSYFGCLTDEQAARYLHWAGADLALAVLLVEHDLHAAELALPDPASGRTQAALKCAASYGGHQAPDDIARLNASPVPRERLLAVAPFLTPGGRKITVDDINTVMDLLRYQDGAPLDLQVNLLPGGRGVVVYGRSFNPDEGKLTIETSSVTNNRDGIDKVTVIKVERHGEHFASLRSPPQDKKSMISNLLAKAMKTSQSRSLKSCGDACEYTESLKMRLHGMIHALYLKAFTVLPSNVSRRLVRDILFAGHCYGPMDPVSNIIINSIWHSKMCPLPPGDSEIEVYDILDPLLMLRVEFSSLKGLIGLVQANSNCSLQQAMEHLCCKRCDLSEEMCTLQDGQFATAASAAQHPQYAALGSFLSSLTPHVLDNLRPLLSTTNGTLSSESLHRVECILTKELGDPAVMFAPKDAELCREAEETLLKKRSEYKNFRSFIRSELAEVLQKYAAEHPQEPKYVTSVICGVEETNFLDRDCYHVNFVASSESGADNQLFFAELNMTLPEQSKPNFCQPLRLTYTGRCYYGGTSSRKIVYPDSSDYFECDITSKGTKHTDTMLMLEVDFVFDFSRDVQFAKDVRQYYENAKALSEMDMY